MNPALIPLILGLVELLVKYEPTIAADLRDIFSKADPTPADWMALRAKVQAASFEALAPDAKTD